MKLVDLVFCIVDVDNKYRVHLYPCKLIPIRVDKLLVDNILNLNVGEA